MDENEKKNKDDFTYRTPKLFTGMRPSVPRRSDPKLYQKCSVGDP
jgi:hypothetical protein